MAGCLVSKRKARAAAAPVAQRTNSSTAAAKLNERSSTWSRNSFHDLKPYSRAITNWASCKARFVPPVCARSKRANVGSTPKRASASGSFARAARRRVLACFLSCSRLARSGNCCVFIYPCFPPGVRNRAARIMAVQSVYLVSGLGPLREPAGAWSARRDLTPNAAERQAALAVHEVYSSDQFKRPWAACEVGIFSEFGTISELKIREKRSAILFVQQESESARWIIRVAVHLILIYGFGCEPFRLGIKEPHLRVGI